MIDWVEELEVWNENDPYAWCDPCCWCEDDPYFSWYENLPYAAVRHAYDAMVIFKPSHVVPLFVASTIFRWPWSTYCDEDCIDPDDPDEVLRPVNLWYGPRGPVLDWQSLKIPIDVNDRLDRRGWVARYGHRNLLSGPADVDRCVYYVESTPAKRLKRKGSHAHAIQQKQHSNKSSCRSGQHRRPATKRGGRHKVGERFDRSDFDHFLERKLVAAV